MHWNFVKKVSKLPVLLKDCSLMTERIAFGPTGLSVALDTSSDIEATWFS